MPNTCKDCGKSIGRQAIRCNSCAAKYRWTRAEYRRKQRETSEKPETRKRLSEQTKAAWDRGIFEDLFSTAEIRQKRSRITSELWTTSEYRSAQAEAHKNPDYRQHQQEMIKQAWERGDFNGIDYSERSQKWIGHSNPNWKPPAHFQCEQCGAVIVGIPCEIEGRRYCSNECHGLAMRGSGNHCWQGGISFEPYGPKFNDELKDAVRARDGYCCQLCGKEQGDRALDVHHIDYDKHNNNLSNLISLCQHCHRMTNHKRRRWRLILESRKQNASAATE